MSETIDQTYTRLSTFISETYPSSDVAPGTVLSELILKAATSIQNPIVNQISSIDQSRTISDAMASAVDTYNPVLDRLASNYGVVRSQGISSTGTIKVIVANKGNYYLSVGLSFLQPALNLSYLITADYTVSSNPTGDNVALVIEPDGTYSFMLPVVAASVGSQYQLSDGTSLTPTNPVSINSFVNAIAVGNFTTGLPIETDKNLIARFQIGASQKTLISPIAIQSKLQSSFPNVLDIAVIGANDPEMLRGRNGVFNTFGMADVHIKSSISPDNTVITVTATPKDSTTWQFTLDQTNAPAGFYEVLAIRSDLATLGTYPILTQTFGFDASANVLVNRVTDFQQARFSKYQTCNVTFSYSDVTNTTLQFVVIVANQPSIADIQDLFLTSSSRIPCADYLVKAVTPCAVSINLQLAKKNVSDTIPVNSIQQDIFNYINTLPFNSSVYASNIVKICHNYNISYVDLPITMIGHILANDGSTQVITSNDVLTIPTNLALGISPNTTSFYTNYYTNNGSSIFNNIGISIV